MKNLFTGVGTALLTPFFADGSIDYESLSSLIETQIAEGVDALIICGTTGEPATMTYEERATVVDFCIKAVCHRVPVIVGTGSNSTDIAVRLTKAAESAGADGVLAVTPYYNKCTQRGLIAHFRAIADSTTLPVILYNVPSRTGVNILPETAAELAIIDNIVGIKEACGNIEQISETIRLTRGKMDVISGDDGIVVPIMALGGTGVISVASNIIPRYMHDLCAKMLQGDTAGAADMQLRVNPLVKTLFSEVNPIPVKQAAAFLGLCTPTMRMPLTTMESAHADILLRTMRDFGLAVK